VKLEHPNATACLQVCNKVIGALGPDRLARFGKDLAVREQLDRSEQLLSFFESSTADQQWAVVAILLIGQSQVFDGSGGSPEALKELVDQLVALEKFYAPMGGIVGYHAEFLKRLVTPPESALAEALTLRVPTGWELSGETTEYAKWGIESLDQLAELYPAGGAGDRLDLADPVSGEALPAVKLPFMGRTLLEGLIRDLEGREYLHYRLTGIKLVTPIGIMTSAEKGNSRRVRELCKKNNWFGRGEANFFLFEQPLAPVISEEGNWLSSGPCQLELKPGGHGVLWRLASELGVLKWFEERGRSKLLVRQINNPIAGTDSGLLSFAGIGCHENKDFGFASCDRLLNRPEGMNVLVQSQSHDGFHTTISNIEYTEFSRYGIADTPRDAGSPYSVYPCNTNILFADIQRVNALTASTPLPGMLINLKTSFGDGGCSKRAGRLESTMQNIADFMGTVSDDALNENDVLRLPTYLTYGPRRTTLSVSKQKFVPGKPIEGTPQGAYYQVLQNARDLLSDCGMDVPVLASEDQYISAGPNIIFHYHPSLGPLYSVIRQKIRGGSIQEGGELHLELAELDLQSLDLEGSLLVTGLAGSCRLQNVKVRNQGIDRDVENTFWDGGVVRSEALTITLQGHSRFVAEDVCFDGNMDVVVPDNVLMRAIQEGDSVRFETEALDSEESYWSYSWNADLGVALSKIGAKTR
jgi:hypothetical protein